MKATARLRVEAPCRIVELTSAPPFSLRSDRAGTVWLVGSAAGPLGGDDLVLQIEVGAGARVAIGSVAAQLVLPGTTGAPAQVRIEANVAAEGHLDWCPEPTVVAAGAHLHQQATVDVAGDATLRWREVVVLGRHGEAPGTVSARLDVDLAGRPLLRHELAAGPGAPDGWDGPAGLAGNRAVAAGLVAGVSNSGPVLLEPFCDRNVVLRPHIPVTERGARSAVTMPLEGGGVLTLAAAVDGRTAVEMLSAGATGSMV